MADGPDASLVAYKELLAGHPVVSADGSRVALPRVDENFNLAGSSRTFAVDFIDATRTGAQTFESEHYEVPKGCEDWLDKVPAGQTVERRDDSSCALAPSSQDPDGDSTRRAEVEHLLKDGSFAPGTWKPGTAGEVSIDADGLTLAMSAKRNRGSIAVVVEAHIGKQRVGSARTSISSLMGEGFVLEAPFVAGVAIFDGPAPRAYVKITSTEVETAQGGMTGENRDSWITVTLTRLPTPEDQRAAETVAALDAARQHVQTTAAGRRIAVQAERLMVLRCGQVRIDDELVAKLDKDCPFDTDGLRACPQAVLRRYQTKIDSAVRAIASTEQRFKPLGNAALALGADYLSSYMDFVAAAERCYCVNPLTDTRAACSP